MLDYEAGSRDDDDNDDAVDDADFSMVLMSLRPNDAGFYQCIVNNSVAMESVAMATTYLHVTLTSPCNHDVVDDVRQRARGRHRGGQ